MAAEAYGIKVVAALGLPGLYTTKSSAKVLADAILEHSKMCIRDRDTASAGASLRVL